VEFARYPTAGAPLGGGATASGACFDCPTQQKDHDCGFSRLRD